MSDRIERRFIVVNRFGEEDLLDSSTTPEDAERCAAHRNIHDGIDGPHVAIPVTVTYPEVL